MMHTRTWDAESSYRFGFQGQERDDEIKGAGNSLNYTYRMHDPRLGRFFAVDPLTAKYPFYSPYQFSGNRLIDAIELEGLEPYFTNETGEKNNYPAPQRRDHAGPMTKEAAIELGYNFVGGSETVISFTFTENEVTKMAIENDALRKQMNGELDCTNAGARNAENLTGVSLGWDTPNGNVNVLNKNAISIGKALQGKGAATPVVPTTLFNETNEMLLTAQVNIQSGQGYSAFLVGPANAGHVMIVVINNQTLEFSVYDQFERLDLKPTDQSEAQERINEFDEGRYHKKYTPTYAVQWMLYRQEKRPIRIPLNQ